MTLLTPDQVAAGLRSLPAWARRGDAIVREYQFADFAAAVRFVNAVAEVADELWHHPDVDIRWNRVTLALTTHDAGGLTELDLALAARIDAL
jgi:4a-hydroxytetrahydrobiopterin dehydratase